MSSLWQINLNINKEYLPMINDLYRMAIIQVVAQLLFFCTNPSKNYFFDEMFMQTFIFIMVGIAVYWLILQKIVVFN
jgi:hypothetical protein